MSCNINHYCFYDWDNFISKQNKQLHYSLIQSLLKTSNLFELTDNLSYHAVANHYQFKCILSLNSKCVKKFLESIDIMTNKVKFPISSLYLVCYIILYSKDMYITELAMSFYNDLVELFID